MRLPLMLDSERDSAPGTRTSARLLISVTTTTTNNNNNTSTTTTTANDDIIINVKLCV